MQKLKNPLFALPLALLVACLLAGCASDQLDELTAGSPPPSRKLTCPYTIAPLDQAHIVSRDGTRQTVQVTADGTLETGSRTVTVKGMSAAQFRAMLHREYPDAARVEIEEFQLNRVTVLGEVFHQIHTDLGDGPMRLMDAIAAANGFTPLANKRRVKLIRRNADEIEVYELDLRQMMYGNDAGQNLLLKPGDVITVPRNFL